MAGRLHRWPLVIRVHCPWEKFVRINRVPFNPMNRLLASLERRTARSYADAVTVPSRAMRDVVVRNWELRRQPVVFPNFMNIPEHRHPMPDEGGPWMSAMPQWDQFLDEQQIWDVILFLYDFTGNRPRAREAVEPTAAHEQR